ncbi:MAG: uroporphyrinogen-III synthase [Alphaproteobacteria bacterium]|nr:uroporphyrinogen-III synthase [Alphaproteobacteria bacterium]
MVNILITRPQAASEKLAQELGRAGYDGVIEPLLTIVPSALPMPDAENPQAVMITSGNVFEVLDKDSIENLLPLPCFCVGPRTADKARDFGFRDVRHSDSDGTALAQLIGESLAEKTSPILHIAAQDIDSGGQDELQRLGYQVAIWPLYVALAAGQLSGGTTSLLAQRKIDAVLVFSVRTAETLVALLKQRGLEACCESLTAIGLSESVAEALRVLRWRSLAAAPEPSEESVIACLRQLHPVSGGS